MNLAEPQKPKGRWCFFYGCITCLVLLLIAGIGGFVAFRYVVGKINGFIDQYTDTSPITLPRVDLPADELKQLKARSDAFKVAVDAGSNAAPLVLTGREVNALLTNGAGASDLGSALGGAELVLYRRGGEYVIRASGRELMSSRAQRW